MAEQNTIRRYRVNLTNGEYLTVLSPSADDARKIVEEIEQLRGAAPAREIRDVVDEGVLP